MPVKFKILMSDKKVKKTTSVITSSTNVVKSRDLPIYDFPILTLANFGNYG